MRTNFKMENENITMVRGDTVSFNAELFDQYGDAVAVDTATFVCAERLGGSPIFTRTLNHGITQSDGMLTVRIAPENTSDIDEGIYYYDFKIGIEDDVYTLKRGSLSIEWDA